ncbi:MAG: haloacid dehalogenase-like hydrolase, partial [Eggerthellaceae bacterium]|nr:haloacid dehalogenase-like hydrolase [Eggerthellaceae bacterium]
AVLNVYDFDGTIYSGDSSIDFYIFSVKRNHFALKALPRQVKAFIEHGLGRISKTEMKEEFYSYFPYVNDMEKNVLDFWSEHGLSRIKDYYLLQQREDDLIASASPEFLLRPVCEALGINRLIASEVDPLTGRYHGLNCRDTEKLRRIHEEYPGEVIECAYSDSHADDPLAAEAKKAYFVSGDKISPWRM